MNNKTGIISTQGADATIIFERRLAHPIDKVWAAITEPRHRESWFGPTTIEPKEGGIIVTIAEGPPAPEDVRRSKGRVRVWNPPNIFEYEEEASNVGNTLVRFELKSEGKGTLLRLKNSRLSASDARGYASGWHAFLDRLESHLNGVPLPEWGKRYSSVQQSYAE